MCMYALVQNCNGMYIVHSSIRFVLLRIWQLRSLPTRKMMGTWKVMRKNNKVEPQLAINFVGGASDIANHF